MDYFYRTFETAQERARQAAVAASTSAQSLAQQVQAQTATLSEQASERIKSLHLQEAVQKHVEAFSQQRNSDKAGPSQEQLEAYAITPDFQAFVRSLTYSTFRDFPQQDQLPEHSADPSSSSNSIPADQAQGGSDSMRYLTPWQEQHALLVVQAVQEINELRFVLCPKRMTDRQFWHTYFQLARKHLPEEAFDPSHELPQQQKAEAAQPPDLQARFSQLSASAQSWGATTAAKVAALTRTSPSKAEAASSKDPAAAPSGSAVAQQQQQGRANDTATAAGHPEPEDSDLDTYLQDALARDHEEGAEGEDSHSHGTSSAGGDDDFDQYLRELNAGGAKHDDEARHAKGSDDECSTPDLDDYVKDLQAD